MPDLYEALGWIGTGLDDVHGTRVGTVADLYVDHGRPEALVVRAGRLRHRELVVAVTEVERRRRLLRRVPRLRLRPGGGA